jgi:hypothetical protein
MPLQAQQEDIAVSFFADRRCRDADRSLIEGQQLPEQFIDEQPRDLIAMSDPRDLSIHTQTQKRLHRNVDASYIVSIGPSHELHGGQSSSL